VRNKRFFKPPRHTKRPQRWDALELAITDMSHDGRGIARVDERVVFVEGALLGETVLASCQKSLKDFDEAITQQVIIASDKANRVEPFCGWYDRCGGCQLQHWSHSAQRQNKHEQLIKLMTAVNPEVITVDPLLSGPVEFRHRLKLAVRASGEQLQFGLREKKSHQLVIIDSCAIAAKKVNDVISALPAWLNYLDASHYKQLLRTLTAVEIDCDSADVMGLVFQFNQKPSSVLIERIVSVLCSDIKALTVQFKSGSGQKQPWQTSYSHGQLTLATGGTHLAYQPGDFTQTNLTVNQSMINQALTWLNLSDKDKALDLFSGMGNFSIAMAKLAKTVTAYEGEQDMVNRLSSNAEAEDIDNLKCYAKDLFDEHVVLPKASVALIDPPRSGAKAVCKGLAAMKSMKRVVYVSCHPGTLARDAKLLQEGGLTLIKGGIIDMFPHSGHSEAMALFER